MKKVNGYTFYDSWQLRELDIQPDDEFIVQQDVDDLKKGERIRFVGFDDVDNHFGIFVFVDPEGNLLEVRGDCSGPDHTTMKQLKAALGRK